MLLLAKPCELLNIISTTNNKQNENVFTDADVYANRFGWKAQTNTINNQTGDAFIGIWQTDDQKAHITINWQDSLYFGRLSNAAVSIGQTAKINLPTGFLGINRLRDFKFSGDNRWDGTIYDPKSKNSYQCYLKLNDDGTLKVRGYKGISLFGKSQVWTRLK